MDDRTRITLLAGGSVLGVLLAGLAVSATFGWRRAQLAQLATSSPSPWVDVAAPPAEPRPSGSRHPPLVAGARTDSDADGLPDALEPLYGANPQNRDTDGDGYSDGSEVANGYDPTVRSPNDRVAGSTPSPGTRSYTQLFFERVGLPASRDNLLKSGELEAFVARVNSRTFLPDVRDGDLRIVEGSGKRVIAAYLDAVSLPQNKKLTAIRGEDIDRAFRALTERKDAKPLDAVLATLDTNLEELRRAPVPREALSLHRQYVAATISLREHVEALRHYRSDIVGVLIAASRIDILQKTFQSIAAGMRELEQKYSIT